MSKSHSKMLRSGTEKFRCKMEYISKHADSERVRRAAQHLDESLKAALNLPNLTRDLVSFTIADVVSLSPQEREQLVNPWSVGLGCLTAPTAVLGLEQAFDLDKVLNFTLEGPGLPILWLSNGDPDIAAQLAGESVESWNGYRPFHEVPNDHATYRVTKAQSTWGRLARVAGALTELDWRTFLEPRNGHLDQRTIGRFFYQIERSAFPAKNNNSGRTTDDQRKEMLRDWLRESEVTSVLMHGYGQGKLRSTHHALAYDLADAFLQYPGGGVPRISTTFVTNPKTGSQTKLQWSRHNQKLVIFARALSNGISDAYCEAIARLLKGEDLPEEQHNYRPRKTKH
jgi:hypothetical protein